MKIYIRLAIILLTVVAMWMLGYNPPEAAFADGEWYNPSWAGRKSILINNTQVSGSSDLTNFPVLVSLGSDGDLAADAQDDGDDILFTSSDGTTKLDHEVESFNGSTGALVAWVEVPVLSGSIDTELFIYYGNSGATNQENAEGVWDSNYKMVQHLSETSGTHFDSTSNNNDSTTVSVTTQGSAAGKIGGADEFDGSTDYVEISNSGSIDISGSETITGWIFDNNADYNHMNAAILCKSNISGENEPFCAAFEWGFIFFQVRKSWTEETVGYNVHSNGYSSQEWLHFAMTRDVSHNVRIYLNGVLEAGPTAIQSAVGNTKSLFIGNEEGLAAGFNGRLDEIRIANSVRSIDWIVTEYNNQNSPSTFYSLGSEESSGSAPTLSLTALSPDPNNDSTPSLSGTANDDGTIASVEYQVDSTGGSWSACVAGDGTFDEASETFSCTTGALSDGSHTVYVRTTDNDALTSENESDSFTLDATAPQVSLTPLTPDPNTDTTPAISGTVTDTTGTVSTVQYQVDSTGGSWSACVAGDGTFDEASETFSCTTGVLSDGSHTIYIRASDALSNLSTNASDVFVIDTAAPIISSVSTTPSTNAVTIQWNTNENSSSKVDYGLSNSYGEATAETDTSPRVTSHSVGVSTLAACSTYHFRVRSTDSLSHEVIGSDNTFTTTGCTGSATVVDQTNDTITTAAGGSLNLLDDSNGITITVPAAFDSSDANFQIKQLETAAVLDATSVPTGLVLVGSYLYDLKALTDTTTILSSFDNPITVTFDYSTVDVEDIIESGLTIHRWDGSSWQQLSGCTIDTELNTISCTTSQFSIFGLFGEEDQSTDDDSSGNSSQACNDVSPGAKAPWIYGATAEENNSVRLYFTAADEPVKTYTLEYGTKSGTYAHGVQDLGLNSRSQMSYVVSSLLPNTTYYFRVRGGNGCATGKWSNEISLKTKSLVNIGKLQISTELEENKPGEETVPTQQKPELTPESYALTVKVLNDQGKPVEGAKVTIHSKVQEGVSDKDGLVTFKNVEPGAHRLLIAYQGYEGEQALNISGDTEEIAVTVRISPQNIYLTPQFVLAVSVAAVVSLALIIVLMRRNE